ncbi:NAD(P)H-binding protein [Fertoebacter nigrum]|uniref:NAD(P)H-binding protein n=1 Tax=Fertoeibacter niger TaxID=2656921 RepID=A0A8X8H3H3_9RHOB|nr:NAD-dependent epimerase/dehydratase family protein [Fertoeibacter niger]NUB45629.1 NAD(P)H-binding protein [Fertoeibacter niger]
MTSLHLVLGSGPLGLATARALLARDHTVRLVNRRGAVEGLPNGATVVTADLSDAGAMRNAAMGATAIYFCVQPPYHLWPTEFPALQDNAIRLAEAARARLVVAENLYGYGPVDGPMTEKTPLIARTRKGSTRAAMHRALLAAFQDGRIDMAVARGADFFGPGVTQAALGAEVFTALLSGAYVRVLGNPDLPHSYTYVPDFGTAMAILGTDPRASGGVFHVPNAPVTTTRAMIREAGEIAGLNPRIQAITPWQLRLLSLAIKPLREMVELSYQATRPFVADHAKFVATFGDIVTPRTQALAETLASLRPAADLRLRIPVQSTAEFGAR